MADLLTSLNRNGSGIDLKALTTSLVAAEFQPRKDAVEARISETQSSISALGQLRSQLDKLATAGKALAVSPILVATSSGSAASVEIKDSSKVVEGTSQIYVDALAKRQVIEFGGFASRDTTLGSGAITIETGIWSDISNDVFLADPEKAVQTANIAAGSTLEEIATKLSEMDGLIARVIDKGDGTFSLGIVTEVGVGSSVRLSVQEDAASPGLSALDMMVGAAEHQVQPASDAVLEVDGFVVLRSSNTIDDLIPGTTVTLNAVGETVVGVSRDRETTARNLEYLTISMNETLSLVKDLTARGAGGLARGALAGDVAGADVSKTLRDLMMQPVDGHRGGSVTLADMGISIQRDGTFAFERAGFDAAFDRDPALFDAAFSDRLDSETDGVFITGTPGTQASHDSFSFLRPSGYGAAQIDGRFAFASSLGDGRTEFVPFGGGLAGTTITVRDGIETATITYAKSFTSLLQSTVESLLDPAGGIAGRETQLAKLVAERTDELSRLNARSISAEDRYIAQFSAMEVAITQLKGTGEFLTNLIDQWNKDSGN